MAKERREIYGLALSRSRSAGEGKGKNKSPILASAGRLAAGFMSTTARHQGTQSCPDLEAPQRSCD